MVDARRTIVEARDYCRDIDRHWLTESHRDKVSREVRALAARCEDPWLHDLLDECADLVLNREYDRATVTDSLDTALTIAIHHYRTEGETL